MSDRADLFNRYLEATSDIELVLNNLTDSDLESRETPDDWTIRQIIHHLADVEVGDAMRLRLMIAHNGPLITAYDEELFAQRLHYERPIETSLALFAQLRAVQHRAGRAPDRSRVVPTRLARRARALLSRNPGRPKHRPRPSPPSPNPTRPHRLTPPCGWNLEFNPLASAHLESEAGIMADAAPSPQPPALGESLRRQWAAFGEWGYERHSRWGRRNVDLARQLGPRRSR